MCEYKSITFKWSGRVDSTSEKLAFRWHQVVKQIDLKKDRFDFDGSVVLLGFCSDEGVKRNKGRIGAKNAPGEVRKYLASLPWHWDNLKLYDAGDVIVNDDLESGQKLLGELVKIIKDKKGFPVIIGGGHEVAYGTFLGVKDYNISIVNFDAHFDNRPYDDAPSSGTMFAQIADELKEEYKYFCLGIQKSGNTRQLFERNERFGGKYLFAYEVKNRNFTDEIRNYLENADYIYTTVCMDVFSSDIACGVSAPTPFGISPDDFLFFAEKIVETGKLIAFDIAEINPEYDIDGRTARLGANIIFYVIDAISRWGYR